MKTWLNTVHVKKEWAHAKKETVRHEVEYQCRISSIFGYEKPLSEIPGLCNRTGHYFCNDFVYAIHRSHQSSRKRMDQQYFGFLVLCVFYFSGRTSLSEKWWECIKGRYQLRDVSNCDFQYRVFYESSSGQPVDDFADDLILADVVLFHSPGFLSKVSDPDFWTLRRISAVFFICQIILR